MGEIKPTCTVNVIWELGKALCTDQSFWGDVLFPVSFPSAIITMSQWHEIRKYCLSQGWLGCMSQYEVNKGKIYLLVSYICLYRMQPKHLWLQETKMLSTTYIWSDLDFLSDIRQLNKQEILKQHMENILKFGVLLFGGFYASCTN